MSKKIKILEVQQINLSNSQQQQIPNFQPNQQQFQNQYEQQQLYQQQMQNFGQQYSPNQTQPSHIQPANFNLQGNVSQQTRLPDFQVQNPNVSYPQQQPSREQIKQKISLKKESIYSTQEDLRAGFIDRNYHYQFGQNLLTKSNIPPKRSFQISQNCKICFSQIETDIAVSKCGHSFHQTCNSMYIKEEIQQNRLQIKCPQTGCGNYVSQGQIRKAIPKDQFDRLLMLQLQQFAQKFSTQDQYRKLIYCPKPECGAFYVSAFPQTILFYCAKCNLSYCMRCKTGSHKQLTCEENMNALDPKKREAANNAYFQNSDSKQCISCKVWVSKTEGCNHMTCKCGYEFCYKCGRKYRDPQCKCPLFDRFPQ